MAEINPFPGKVTGIVLAGGRSSRMGSDKSFICYQGKYLIEYAVGILMQHCGQVLLSANLPGYEQFGLKIIPDLYENCGPAGGIFSAVSASETEYNLVAGCDMPFISSELINLLFDNADGSDCIVPSHGHEIEPVVALYRKSALPGIDSCLKNKVFKMHKIINFLDSKLVDVSALVEKNPVLFRNFNSPGDIDEIKL